jgi:hypothetical protein
MIVVLALSLNPNALKKSNLLYILFCGKSKG